MNLCSLYIDKFCFYCYDTDKARSISFIFCNYLDHHLQNRTLGALFALNSYYILISNQKRSRIKKIYAFISTS